MSSKFASRKFWACIVAFFGSIAGGIAALNSGNDVVAGIGIAAGIIAGAASAVCYVLAEASIDKAAVEANQTVTTNTNTTSVSATSASQKAVEAAFATKE